MRIHCRITDHKCLNDHYRHINRLCGVHAASCPGEGVRCRRSLDSCRCRRHRWRRRRLSDSSSRWNWHHRRLPSRVAHPKPTSNRRPRRPARHHLERPHRPGNCPSGACRVAPMSMRRCPDWARWCLLCCTLVLETPHRYSSRRPSYPPIHPKRAAKHPRQPHSRSRNRPRYRPHRIPVPLSVDPGRRSWTG